MKAILLSTAYLPNIAYLSHVLSYQEIYIEQYEHFIKQTYRNRCELFSSNGKQILSIPLIKQADKELIKDKRISYAEDWQKQHWRAITSAYKNSPYFEYFEDDLKPFYETPYEFLLEYNTALLHTILHILRVKKTFQFTSQYESKPTHYIDLRDTNTLLNSNNYRYYQIFANKHGFISNLSCLDCLFHIGLETKEICSIKF